MNNEATAAVKHYVEELGTLTQSDILGDNFEVWARATQK